MTQISIMLLMFRFTERQLLNDNEGWLCAGNGGYGVNPECRFLTDTVEKLDNLDGRIPVENQINQNFTC